MVTVLVELLLEIALVTCVILSVALEILSVDLILVMQSMVVQLGPVVLSKTSDVSTVSQEVEEAAVAVVTTSVTVAAYKCNEELGLR
jgi:hypothetical protein